MPLFTKEQTLLRVAEVTADLAESNGSLPPGMGYLYLFTFKSDHVIFSMSATDVQHAIST